ncbi:MAG: DUF2934 domain-containing protein [Terriglobales bacterium]|jgi:hypothetical protein
MPTEKRTSRSPKTAKSKTNDVARITTQTVDIQQVIRERAYELYLQRGGQHGCDTEDWLRAEAEVLRHFGAKAA